MAWNFLNFNNRLETSAVFYPVVPNDAVDLDQPARALLIASGGALVVNDLNGTTRTLTVPAGLFPGVVTRVFDTGTDATGITALV